MPQYQTIRNTWRERRRGSGRRARHLAVVVAVGLVAIGFSPSVAATAGDNVGKSITFDLPNGTLVTTQYRSYGVIFDGNGDGDPFVVNDGSASTNPVLSGQPTFEGDVHGKIINPATGKRTTSFGVSMDIGYINNPGSVEIVGYDLAGNKLIVRQANGVAFNHITLNVRGLASFLIQSIGQEDAGWEVDNVTILKAAAGVKVNRMASLGDSYTSGEGLLSSNTLHYDCGTDLNTDTYYQGTSAIYGQTWYPGLACDIATGSWNPSVAYRKRPEAAYTNLCHRAPTAYPNKIRTAFGLSASSSLFVACSGARTRNIGVPGSKDSEAQYGNTSPYNVAGGKTQDADLAEYIKSKGKPDLLTVGIGGNDAEFANVVQTCAVKTCRDGQDYTSDKLKNIADNVYPELVRTFRGIRFSGKTTAVFGYPLPVKPGAFCPGVLALDKKDQTWLIDRYLTSLNQAIADAATVAGVTYVDVSHAFDGHGICSGDAWVNGLRVGFKLGVSREAFHPNQFGQQALGQYFLDHYTDGHGKLTFTNPAPLETLRPPSPPQVPFNGGAVQASFQNNCGITCVQQQVCATSCSIRLQGQGFTPGATLNVTLRSEPVSLGNVTADKTGDVEAVLRVPAGKITPGAHTVTLSGTTIDGDMQVTELGETELVALPADPRLTLAVNTASCAKDGEITLRGVRAGGLLRTAYPVTVVLEDVGGAVIGAAVEPLRAAADGEFSGAVHGIITTDPDGYLFAAATTGQSGVSSNRVRLIGCASASKPDSPTTSPSPAGAGSAPLADSGASPGPATAFGLAAIALGMLLLAAASPRRYRTGAHRR